MTHALTLLRTGRGRFRDWRRSRPFWGGVLLVAAGVELLLAPAAQSLILPIDLIVYAGIAGVSGALIAALLITLGALSWLQPAQHVFFGLVGLALALVSFVTSNFGGFVIGMLLGIVGGSLVFAWAPGVRRRSRGRRRAGTADASGPVPEEADASGPGPAEGVTGAGPSEEDDGAGGGVPHSADATAGGGGASRGTAGAPGEGGVADPRPRTGPLAALALPLAVAVVLAGAPAPTLGWPWDWFAPPGGGEEQPEDAPSEDPSEEPSAGPTGEPPEPGGNPGEDGEPQEPGEDEEPEEEPEEETGADPAACELLSGESALAGSEEEFLEAVEACRAARDEGELPDVPVDEDHDCFQGSVRTSGLTADTLTMRGARYDGVVECPTADGPRRYIMLSMRQADVDNGELWFEDGGTRMSLGLPTMNLTGDVRLHITRMHVRLLGIPLTFTPDFPPPLLLPFMIVTDVEVDNPMAGTDSMTIPNLNGQYGGGG
ncbi:DUF6114 domain-containing protein [Streptomonospora nanhaiensis]|uniref:DUF6114 domain-containing protein n=1 Tax=Streptomonospora nanhaiensis TaxID=1323731 RepID=A0ABY6YJP8_9ACTN|nr:DUF6114 domain-containing protein [Streptomonospora nanhaiensis]WAE72411.1 DUF6114 domain-containing protein [Streptomonospora nanhaiensis]